MSYFTSGSYANTASLNTTAITVGGTINTIDQTITQNKNSFIYINNSQSIQSSRPSAEIYESGRFPIKYSAANLAISVYGAATPATSSPPTAPNRIRNASGEFIGFTPNDGGNQSAGINTSGSYNLVSVGQYPCIWFYVYGKAVTAGNPGDGTGKTWMGFSSNIQSSNTTTPVSKFIGFRHDNLTGSLQLCAYDGITNNTADVKSSSFNVGGNNVFRVRVENRIAYGSLNNDIEASVTVPINILDADLLGWDCMLCTLGGPSGTNRQQVVWGATFIEYGRTANINFS